ncbi:MerR family transcriptional regulator [Bacillus sp. T33-2]|uniref:MerR family transcriptional regulator n=1 Tax=Bacillus sp. T33-2 TaxID=2054168 RepID=UPI000C75D861|nr:MerR family transcriptional regulator [Bacillus sp. T33-2]PLR96550.1 MerR family transcriptional regulator [Bacillus sp. T33-2]
MTATYSIGEFARKTGVTVRTLHYYDEIGLLVPSEISESGRRFYHDEDFITLQKIITLKFVGLPLNEIKKLVQEEKWDLLESLAFQKEIMLQKRNHIDQMIRALDHALNLADGTEQVDPAIFISLINGIQKEQEHKDWLKNFLPEKKVESLFNISKGKQLALEKQYAQITAEFKKAFGRAPEDDHVQNLAEKLVALITEIFEDDLSILDILAEQDLPDPLEMIPSPFSTEEEEWFVKAVGIALAKKGVVFNVTGK